MLPRHYEVTGFIVGTPETVFAYLDDHTRLSSHMTQSSWKMGGGKMELQFDEHEGRAVGSRMRLAGRAFGLALSVEEIITERSPPHHKVWQTVGTPRLFVIAQYRLGFEITAESTSSRVRVFIDYSLPERGLAKWLGLAAGDMYARWCTQQMLRDAEANFGRGYKYASEA